MHCRIYIVFFTFTGQHLRDAHNFYFNWSDLIASPDIQHYWLPYCIIIQESNKFINVLYFLVADRHNNVTQNAIAVVDTLPSNPFGFGSGYDTIDEENVVGGMMAQNVLNFLFTAIPYSMACGLAGKQSDIPAENSVDSRICLFMRIFSEGGTRSRTRG